MRGFLRFSSVELYWIQGRVIWVDDDSDRSGDNEKKIKKNCEITVLQLTFTNREKRPVWLVGSSYTIGSSADDTIKVSEDLGDCQVYLKLEDGRVRLEKSEHCQQTITHNNTVVGAAAVLQAGDTFTVGPVGFSLEDSRSGEAGSRVSAHAETTQRGFRLKSLSAALQFREIVVTSKLLIGRAEECDLTLNTTHLSRRHASIEVDGEELYISDLDSSNGTFVNGQKISQRTQLSAGDEIRFDTLKFRVLSGANAEQEVSGPASSDDVNKTIMRPVPTAGMAAAQAVQSSKDTTAPANKTKASAVQRAKVQAQRASQQSASSQFEQSESAGKASGGKMAIVLIVIAVAIVAGAFFYLSQS